MLSKTKVVAATSAACAVLCGVLAQGSRPACSNDQLTCLDSAKSVIDGLEDIVNPGTTCKRASEAFQDANGCVASCSGADLKELASTCETLSDRAGEFSCNVYCEGITTNQNAYDEATAPSPVVLDANASWPAADFHGNFYAQPLERPGAQDFVSQWSLPLGTGVEARVSPIPLPNGNVAIVSGGDISEVSASGVRRWTVSLAQGEFASQPVADSSRYLYIGDTFGSMHKIDFRAGKLETSWNVGGSGISGAPALTSDFLFVVSKGSPGQAPILHKFPLREGTTGAWKLSVCEHDALRYDMVDDGLTITPDGVVLVACKWQAFVDAYDATNGEAIWSTRIVNASKSVPFSTIIGVPVATSSQIFVTTHRAIVALDAPTGTIQWTQNTDARPAGTVAVDTLSDSVVTVLESGDILQLEGATGSSLADESVETLPVFGPIVDAEGHLVLASGSDILVYSIDDFNISSVLGVDSQVTASPMLLDGRLMVHTQTSLVQLAATIGEGDNSLLEGETLAPVTSAPTTATPSTSAPTSTPPPTIPTTITSSPTESQATSSPTSAPTPAPTPAIAPTIPGSETFPPVTTASPTVRPTKQPTVTEPRDGDEDSPEWSSSAIAAVSTLATIDLILLAAAIGITAKKRKGAKSAGAATGPQPHSPNASAKAVQKRDIESTGQGLENNTNSSSIAAA